MSIVSRVRCSEQSLAKPVVASMVANQRAPRTQKLVAVELRRSSADATPLSGVPPCASPPQSARRTNFASRSALGRRCASLAGDNGPPHRFMRPRRGRCRLNGG
jgi:hypothetical protein